MRAKREFANRFFLGRTVSEKIKFEEKIANVQI